MKTSLISTLILLAFVLLATQTYAADKVVNKYVGTKSCKMCHNTDKIGKQFDIWHGTKHAEAYATLTTPKADEIAKTRGSKKPAVETEECLGCHTITADAAQKDATFDVKDGVQCEVCHGAGSAYKSMAVMKDKEKAKAAGLTIYDDKATTEAFCKKCHNEKSPSYKPFKFDEYWAKIKHDVPKKS